MLFRSVLPVGGIKEKVIAAHRAGIEKVLLPARNEKDLREVPEEVRAQMQFELVDNIAEVLRAALGLEIKPEKTVPSSTQEGAAPPNAFSA